mgnify:CR=1 FL=1
MGKAYIRLCLQELRSLERAVIMGDDNEWARLEDEYVSLSAMADALWDEFKALGMRGEASRAVAIYKILTDGPVQPTDRCGGVNMNKNTNRGNSDLYRQISYGLADLERLVRDHEATRMRAQRATGPAFAAECARGADLDREIRATRRNLKELIAAL